MIKAILAIAACAVAAVVLSACASSRSVAQVISHYRGTSSITFVADGPSTALGVDNTDLYAATPSGRVRDISTSGAAETDPAWSADGRHVVFVRTSTTGDSRGRVAVRTGVFVWSPGHGAPHQIAACSDRCANRAFAWSPDDSEIAVFTGGPHVCNHGNGACEIVGGAIEVMKADGSNVQVICRPSRCGDALSPPAWSPDGQRLLFSSYSSSGASAGAIWTADADGSVVRKLTHSGSSRTPTWSPDGSRIAFTRAVARDIFRVEDDLEVMNADGTQLHTLGRCDGDCRPGWSPTDQTIAWVKGVGRSPEIQLTTITGKTSELRTCDGSRCVYPSEPIWSPDGKRLAFIVVGYEGTGAVWTIRRDGKGLRRITSDADPCCLAWIRRGKLPGRVPPPTPGSGIPHLSGTIAFDTEPGRSGHDTLELLSLATGRLSRIRTPVASSPLGAPSWSPDGREIAFGSTSDSTTNLYVADRDGRHLRKLTHLSWVGEAKEPAWSPNGRDIAFVTGHGEIDLIRPDGTAPARQLVANSNNPSWAPGGRALVFGKPYVTGGPSRLYTIRTDGSGLMRLTDLPGDQINPAWSPSGDEIAFDWVTTAGDSIYLIRPDGTHLRRVTTQAVPGGRPAWSPDGRYLLLFSISSSQTSSGVVVVNAKTGRVTTLYPKVPLTWSDPAWSPR